MASDRPDGNRAEVGFRRQRESLQAEPIGGGDNASGGVDLAAVWSALRAGKWLILASVALATAAAVSYSMLVPPTYQAASVVSLGVVGTPLPGAESVLSQLPDIESELGRLQRSTDLAQRVYDELEATAASLGTEEFFPVLQPENRDGMPGWAEVSSRMSFGVIGVGMIQITSVSTAPEEAAQLANVYAEEYAVQSRERARASLVAAREFLEVHIHRSDSLLTQLQREWERYSRDREIVAQGPAGERLVAEYSTLLGQREDIAFQRRKLSDTNEMIRAQLLNLNPNDDNSALERYQSRIATLEEAVAVKQAAIEAWFLEDPTLEGNPDRYHPQLQAAISERNKLELDLSELRRLALQETINSSSTGGSSVAQASELRFQLEANERAIRIHDSEIQQLNEKLAGLQARIGTIPGQVFEVDEMQRRRDREQAYLEALRNKLRDYTIAEQAELGFVSVERPATIPRTPVAPDLQGNLIMALLLGTVFGAGLAFLRSAVSNQLQSPDEVENLGYRLLGVVPSMQREIRDAFKGRREIEINGKVRSTALVTLHSPWSPAAEHYRLVRTNLQAIARDTGTQIILVTSPEPADGKTISSVNLAISMAQNGNRTLLIDCDLRKASVAKALGVNRSPGMGEMLTDGDIPDDGFKSFKTDIDDLYCIPAGQVKSPPPELLGSEDMVEILARARENFDVVIVDSPPVLAVTDAVVLAPLCDFAVVVVAANKTSPRGVKTTITTLRNLGVSIAGVVFNQFNQQKSYGRGGYYDYQYGYAYADESE